MFLKIEYLSLFKYLNSMDFNNLVATEPIIGVVRWQTEVIAPIAEERDYMRDIIGDKKIEQERGKDIRPPAEKDIKAPIMPMDKFWNLIDKFWWANRDDGDIDERLIELAINTICETEAQREKFIETYENVLKCLVENLAPVFGDECIFDEEDKYAIASHFIALGQDWAENISKCADVAKCVIISQLYQDFHTIVFTNMIKK